MLCYVDVLCGQCSLGDGGGNGLGGWGIKANASHLQLLTHLRV